MDGWALLAGLKADSALAGIPVILPDHLEDRNLGFALGASEYLTKPIDRKKLAALVNATCRALGGPVLVVEDDPGTRALLARRWAKPAGR